MRPAHDRRLRRSDRAPCSASYRRRSVLGLHADDVPGVPLQRHLLHLRAGADATSTASPPTASAGTCCRSRSATSSARCCWAGCSTRWAGGSMISGTYIISGVGLAVAGYLFQQDAVCATELDGRLVGHLLLRLGRRQLRLPDRQRDLPDGDAGDGDRLLLRLRDRRRRHHRAGAVWPQHRHAAIAPRSSSATCSVPG